MSTKSSTKVTPCCGSASLTPGVAHSRETWLQLEAFRERRERAYKLIELIREEGSERLCAHLEKLRRLVSGLECSRSFFLAPPPPRVAVR